MKNFTILPRLVRPFLCFLFFFAIVFAYEADAQTSDVNVSVNWPRWSSENRVEIYNGSGTLIASICDPSNCYNGAANTSYSTTVNLGCLLDGNYTAVLYDTYGDGWNGSGDNLTITSGGANVLNLTDNNALTNAGTSYPFTVSGGGPSCSVNPEIDVLGNQKSIVDGDTTPTTMDYTEFGSVQIGNQLTRTFIIENQEAVTLNITSATIGGTSEFSILTPTPIAIAPGNTANFLVRYAPTNTGVDLVTLTINNDDSDENPYDFSLQGSGINALPLGPGGITQNLKLWLRADQGAGATNGTAVSSWTNQGTSSNPTANAGEEPTYKDNATDNVNFNAVVDFDNVISGAGPDPTFSAGGQQYMTGTDGFYTQEIFIVAIPDATVNATMGVMDMFCGDDPNHEPNSEDVSGIGYGAYTAALTNEVITYALNVQSSYRVADNTPGASYSGIAIINGRNNLTDDGMQLYYNANDIQTVEVNQSTYENLEDLNYWIGRSEYFAASLDARIGEIITFASRKDDATERNKIESYLAIKYGITLGVNGTSQDYVDATANVIWDVSNNAGYNYDIAGIGRDDDSSLNQKQSKSENPGSVVTIGLGDIYSTNNNNTSTFNDDKDFLVWGHNGGTMNTDPSNVAITLGTGPGSVTTYTDVPERKWKIVETVTTDISTVKVSVATADLSSLPPLMGNDAYVMLVADDGAFSTNVETVFLETNGANQEAFYDFNGEKFFTFGVAHETVVPRHMEFDGDDDYIDVGDKIDITGPFTVSGWVHINGNNNDNSDRTIISKRAASVDGYHFYVDTSNRVTMRFSNTNRMSSNTALNNSQWRHVAFTYDGTNGNIYIDGVLDNSQAMAPPTTNDYIFAIGARYVNNLDIRNIFNGDIDEIRIWDSALTVTEIRYIMNQEIENDGSGRVDGVILPLTVTKNDINSVPWSNLLAYYSMNTYIGTHLNDASDNDNRGSLVFPDNYTIEVQTAPLPYVSGTNNAWNTNSTWLNGSEMYIPNSTLTINGIPTDIDWNIVVTNTNVSAIDNKVVLGLISNSNELSVRPDNSLTITHYLKLDGVIDFEGESQLLQPMDSDLDVTSSGYIERDQQGTADNFTYNYRSSPVGTPNITSNNNSYVVSTIMYDGTNPSAPLVINYDPDPFAADGPATSPITISEYWIYKFVNGASDDYNSWIATGASGNIQAGEGFTLKGPGTGGITDPQNYVHAGKPNNGTITLPLLANSDYLIGNPYASALDSHEFLNDNPNTSGTIYLWEHFGGASHNLGDYQGGYAMYNFAGGVPTPTIATNDPDVNQGGTPTKLPERYIPVGQGFFVEGVTNGTITFENDQRAFVTESSGNSIFVRDIDASTYNTESDTRMKFRIGFNSPNTIHRQLLLTIDSNATDGVDWAFDGVRNDAQIDDIYWLVEDNDYIIQAVSDVSILQELPVAVDLRDGGDISITIDSLENVPSDMNIYLKNKETGEYFNLRQADFVTNLPAGIHTDIFDVVFSAQVLSNDEFDLDENLSINYLNNLDAIRIVSNDPSIEIEKVIVFNMLGQQLLESTIDESISDIPMNGISTGNYIVKLSTNRGDISKKFVKK